MGKTALITGATSGIGKSFADRFAARGYDLVITGRRKDVIEHTAAVIAGKYDVKVYVILAELAGEKGIRAVLDAIREKGPIDALVNNAGYGLDLTFPEGKIEDHLGMLQVHVGAALRFIHAALPAMLEKRSGIIINVSSLAAWTPAPINGIYGGTKAFLNVFTESLHLEVGGMGIRVQALCPGFTRTEFQTRMGTAEKLKTARLNWMDADDVVDYSLRCLDKGKVLCLPGWRNRVLRALVGRIPRRLYYRVALRIAKKIR